MSLGVVAALIDGTVAWVVDVMADRRQEHGEYLGNDMSQWIVVMAPIRHLSLR